MNIEDTLDQAIATAQAGDKINARALLMEGRIPFRVDRDAKTHQTFYLSGRKYGQLGLWGLAVLHLRRAVAGSEHNSVYHTALAMAFMRIERYDLAEKSLSRAESLAPEAEAVRNLRRRFTAHSKDKPTLRSLS